MCVYSHTHTHQPPFSFNLFSALDDLWHPLSLSFNPDTQRVNSISAMVTLWHHIIVSSKVLAQKGFIGTWLSWAYVFDVDNTA